MITRIKYTKISMGWVTPDYPINAELKVRACVLVGFLLTIVNCDTGDVLYCEQCRNIPAAKRKARKMLEKLGMNFAVEFRRK